MSKMSTTWEISDSEAEVDENSRGHFQSRQRSHDSGERSVSVPPPPFEGDGPSPAKRRRSKEEIEADRDKARQRREAREKNRAAKERQKHEKRKEQEERKEAARRLNSLKPENCLKCLTVCVDPGLLQEPGCDLLLATLSSFEWRYSIRQQPLANSITWTRDLPQGAAGTLAEEEEEDQLVRVLSASQFVDVVIAVKKLIDSDGEELEGHSVLGPLPEGFQQDAAKVATTLLVTESRPESRRHAFAETIRSRYGGGDVDAEEVGSDTSARASGRPKLDDLCAPLPSGSRVSAAAEERGRGLCGKLAGRHRPRVRRHQVLVQTAFEAADGASGAALLRRGLVGRRGARGEGRLRPPTGVEQADPAAQQGQRGHRLLRDRRVPVTAAAAAGLQGVAFGGGAQGAAGPSGGEGRRQGQAGRTRDFQQSLPLPHRSEPRTGPGLTPKWPQRWFSSQEAKHLPRGFSSKEHHAVMQGNPFQGKRKKKRFNSKQICSRAFVFFVFFIYFLGAVSK